MSMSAEMLDIVWKRRDFYDLLEIPRNADADAVSSAYRFQLLAWHPDKFGSPSLKSAAHERTVAINEAYEELSDPEKRTRYDQTPHEEPAPPMQFSDQLMNDPVVWKKMAAWMKENEVGTPFNRSLAYTIGKYLQNRWQLSPKQKRFGITTWELAVGKGFGK